jgi:hypothetical protein
MPKLLKVSVQVASLESTMRQGGQQLKQSREQAAAAQAGMADAQAKVARLDALLRKVIPKSWKVPALVSWPLPLCMAAGAHASPLGLALQAGTYLPLAP